MSDNSLGEKSKGTAGKGRPKGVPNRMTASVKEALSLAFEGIGGVPRLVEWAETNQSDFYKIWVKMLPTDLRVGNPDGSNLFSQDQIVRMAEVIKAKENK